MCVLLAHKNVLCTAVPQQYSNVLCIHCTLQYTSTRPIGHALSSAVYCMVLYSVHLYTRSLIHCTHVLFCNTHYKYKQSIVLVDITCDGVLPVSFVPPLNNVYTLQVQLKQVCVCVRIYIINYKKIYQRLSLGRR